MQKIDIIFPDGTQRSFPRGITPMAIAESISPRLASEVLCARVNEKLVDSFSPLETGGALALLTWKDAEGKATFWHSSAHLMAEALEALYPGIKFGIGPPIAQGFYYDIDFEERAFDASHLPRVEEKMRHLAQQKAAYSRKEVSKKEALTYFRAKKDPYKEELTQELEDGTITFYTQGGFVDLCRGPHIPHTGYIKAIKLLSIAGAYWRGSEKNKQLTRLYGISFPKQSDLKAYLALLEEAKKRDHRKLGRALGLFTFSSRVGVGLPLWLPKGAVLRTQLENFLRQAQEEAGYLPVITPHIGHKDLYLTSGHYEKYKSSSFQPIETPEGEEFLLKPMNCPHHCEIYRAEPRSYKDLPLRLAEFGTVYRYEQSGELQGLTRVRSFTQDDAHIFCMPSQVKEEFGKVIELVLHIFETLGLKGYTAQASFRGETHAAMYIGKDEDWAQAESDILASAEEKGLSCQVVRGEAAFYGPKLDFMVEDALKREWQLGTIQVDYQLPGRFGLEYVGEDGQKHRPVMLHRAPFGSMERFVALLIEHCGGNFPFWLSPEQVIILPISEKCMAYAWGIHERLAGEGFRVRMDERNEKIGRKIRDAELQKIPFMLLMGPKEQEAGTVAVRAHTQGDLGVFSVEAILERFHKEMQIAKNIQ